MSDDPERSENQVHDLTGGAPISAGAADAIFRSSSLEPNVKPDPRDSALPEMVRKFGELLEKLAKLRGEIIELGKVNLGNGWNPEKLIENVYRVEPLLFREIQHKNERTLLRFPGLGRPPKWMNNVHPTLVYAPFWTIKGYYECYYLRRGTYHVGVQSDVVAVEVEGRPRDLMLEHRRRLTPPRKIANKLQRLAWLFSSDSSSKFFVMDDVTELASISRRAELYVSAEGKIGEKVSEVLDRSWRIKRIFDKSELKIPTVEDIRVLDRADKTAVVKIFRDRFVKLPTAFIEILSNRFEIFEISLYYVPYYVTGSERAADEAEWILEGWSGKACKDPIRSRIANGVSDQNWVGQS